MKTLFAFLLLCLFLTPLYAQEVFFEGFESGNTQNQQPTGWTQYSDNEDYWIANTTETGDGRSPRSGNWDATIAANQGFLGVGGSSVHWMFKQVNLIGGEVYTFRMYARQDKANTSFANITVKYGSSPHINAMNHSLIALTNLTNGSYQKLDTSFTPDSSGVYYPGIRSYASWDLWYVSIDDISLYQAPMSYDSSTTTQPNLGLIAGNTTNNLIAGIQVFTSGNPISISLSSFSFKTTGTIVRSDITNAKLWSTGTSPVFAATTQIGSTVVSPDTSFTINSGTGLPVNLSLGTNYFWLTYDISASAVHEHIIDAECSAITIGTPKIPSIQAPPGNRMISTTLAGNYTINNSLPASTTNFTHITEAVDFLNLLGISTSVIFDIPAGQTFSKTCAASPNNYGYKITATGTVDKTITFRKADRVLIRF